MALALELVTLLVIRHGLGQNIQLLLCFSIKSFTGIKPNGTTNQLHACGLRISDCGQGNGASDTA
jgi:hypothetical protein